MVVYKYQIWDTAGQEKVGNLVLFAFVNIIRLFAEFGDAAPLINTFGSTFGNNGCFM